MLLSLQKHPEYFKTELVTPCTMLIALFIGICDSIMMQQTSHSKQVFAMTIHINTSMSMLHCLKELSPLKITTGI